MRSSRHLCLLLALSIVAAACGTSGDGDLVDGTTVDATAVEGTTVEDTAVAGAETAPGSGSSDDDSERNTGGTKTLEDYLGTAAGFVPGIGGGGRGTGGGGFGGGGFESDSFVEEQRLVEQEIQRCMLGEGFEYMPEDPGGLLVLVASEDQGLTPQDFAESRGFGISTRFDSILEGDVNLEESSDPNAEQLATLSEAEADAWQMALRGQPPERNDQGQQVDPETGEIIEGRGRFVGGCTAEAQVAVRGDFSMLAELGDEFEALAERIDADPRLTEIRREWSSCMAESGFDYESIDAARSAAESEFRPLIRSFFNSARDDGAGEDGAGAGRGPTRGGALEVLAEGLSDEQEVELAKLQDTEIAMAVASLGCEGDSAAEIAAVEARYEAEFVDEHRATLESISG